MRLEGAPPINHQYRRLASGARYAPRILVLPGAAFRVQELITNPCTPPCTQLCTHLGWAHVQAPLI